MVSIDGGSASKVDDVTAYPEPSQDGGCYYGNVMTRWWLCVTMETFSTSSTVQS